MLERRRLIVCVVLLALNVCVLLWRMSWEHMKITEEKPSFNSVYRKNTSLEFLTANEEGLSELWLRRGVISEIPRMGLMKLKIGTIGMTTIDDSHRLIDLMDFEYTMDQSACAQNILGLIVVHSAPGNFEKRDQIRETWANGNMLLRSPLRVLFFLGSVKDDALQQLRLVEENDQNGDLVQGNFIDDYRNMTYKHVMALKWFLQRCTHAQLLIKVDDDIFVNTPKLLKCAQRANVLPQHNHNHNHNHHTSSDDAIGLFNKPKKLLLCSKCSRSLVKRTYQSKWRVSYQEYPYRYYPPYCFGYAIIYSSDVIGRLYASAQQHKFFWIDDVHITGVMSQLNGIEITNFSNHLLTAKKIEKLLSNPQPNAPELEFLFAEHDTSLKQMRKLWKLVATQKQQVENS